MRDEGEPVGHVEETLRTGGADAGGGVLHPHPRARPKVSYPNILTGLEFETGSPLHKENRDTFCDTGKNKGFECRSATWNPM